MAAIEPGRHHAAIEEGTVVFFVGMRINRWRAVRDWTKVAAAMPKMIAELQQQPELGLLSTRTFVSGRDILVVQYWRSQDHLHEYARGADHLHLPAWRHFNATLRSARTVGLWHEIHPAATTSADTVYINMPLTGLAVSAGHAPAAAAKPVAAA